MRKPARQGSELAGKGAYIDVSDRRLHVQLTQEAKIAPDFSLFRAIFAFAGFVSALGFVFGETATAQIENLRRGTRRGRYSPVRQLVKNTFLTS